MVTMKRSQSTTLQLFKKWKPMDNYSSNNDDNPLAQIRKCSTVTSSELRVSTTLLSSSHEHTLADLDYEFGNCTEFSRWPRYESISTPRNSIWIPD